MPSGVAAPHRQALGGEHRADGHQGEPQPSGRLHHLPQRHALPGHGLPRPAVAELGRHEPARTLVERERLDEPFTGIDPVTIHSIQKIIKGLRDDGISILITDHRERETLAITDRSYVIRAGKVLCHGSAQEVLSNPDAKKYYFGESPGVEAA